jgi:GT2 family glycosyltransferase
MRYVLQKGADYIFILNNDVVLGVACLSELIGVAEGRLEAGMLAPKVYYYDEPQAINSFGTAIDWFRLRPYLGYCGQKDNGQFTGIRYVDILVGCALLVKKETLNRIGLIDERFFIFHEEADWCLRNIKSGFKNVTVGKAIAYHKASRTMRNFTALTTYYSIRNFLYLAHKNASFVNRIKTFFGCSFLIFKNILLLIFNSRAQRNPKAFLLGILDYLRADMGICKRKL